jgi:uncharacterized protein (TIGR00369 family)
MNGGTLTPDHEERVRQALAKVPFASLLGLELQSIAAGIAVLALPLHPSLTQNSGVVHGGAIASLIDTATAFAIVSLLPEGERVTTIDLAITFLRPLTTGRATATASVLRLGRRVIAVSAEVQADDGSLAATALSNYLRLGTSPPN